jgi:hypothetical protein
MGRRGNGEGSFICCKDELYVGGRFYVETPDGNRTFKTIYGKRCSRCGLRGEGPAATG